MQGKSDKANFLDVHLRRAPNTSAQQCNAIITPMYTLAKMTMEGHIATHIVLHNGTTHIVLASGVIKNTADGGSFVWNLVY